jgi:threonine/homoserine/homoserine lactone efflux protein
MVTALYSYIAMGAVLGLSAGISPGPLLALVITETMRHGKMEGIKVALSPLITDLPIILVSLFILSRLGSSSEILGLISFAGAIFISYLGYECFKTKELIPDLENPAPKSLRKGIVANLLNPHPYLFWITVGAPLVMKAWQTGITAVIAWFLSFYLCLTGSKITVAILVDRSKSFISGRTYVWIMRILGLALWVFAVLFFINGVKMLMTHFQ